MYSLCTVKKHVTHAQCVIHVENATTWGEGTEFYIGGLYCTTSLSWLHLSVARLYLHCGISHWADI